MGGRFWTVTVVIRTPDVWEARDVFDEVDWLVNENIGDPMVELLRGSVKEGAEDG